MTNDKCQMPNQCQNSKVKIFNLEERTTKFGEAIIDFAQELPKNIINNQLITQLVKSGTSIGANYMEADAAESKKDFRHKIGICKKEAKETRYWLRMIIKANPAENGRCLILWKEAHELLLIFSAIIKKSVRDTHGN